MDKIYQFLIKFKLRVLNSLHATTKIRPFASNSLH